MSQKKPLKKAISGESFIFLIIFLGIFLSLGSIMGCVNMINTLMNTAYKLLLETVFFILAIAVLAGAISALLSEFGIVSIINKILSPLMKPLYDLPGAATIGILATYLSDNPAILTLADDRGFRRYFKKYQLPALTNLGTAFGMGLIVTTFMISQKSIIGESFILPGIVGNIGAVVGSIVSTRLMLRFTSKIYGKEELCIVNDGQGFDMINYRETREGSVGSRIMDALLEGGKSGVDMGLAIIPGVLVICTIVLMLTNGPSSTGEYTGAAYEGVKLLPWLGSKLSFIITPLFGFQSSEAIAFPITSLGAVGAALGLVPKMLEQGLIGGNEIAVFTAMGMCWSGYLSTHVAMMDSLKCRELTGKAIISHTFGGLVAGIIAHFLYLLIS
ncbi:nucleoside recognition domain-containing protein [Clostridium sp.]|uniref:CD0519/CD1768 family membrane protein n=1 Tax=Clostridium sp. TaxID=1506 RepID=UPI002FC8D372